MSPNRTALLVLVALVACCTIAAEGTGNPVNQVKIRTIKNGHPPRSLRAANEDATDEEDEERGNMRSAFTKFKSVFTKNKDLAKTVQALQKDSALMKAVENNPGLIKVKKLAESESNIVKKLQRDPSALAALKKDPDIKSLIAVAKNNPVKLPKDPKRLARMVGKEEESTTGKVVWILMKMGAGAFVALFLGGIIG